jgi:hypothetical protein
MKKSNKIKMFLAFLAAGLLSSCATAYNDNQIRDRVFQLTGNDRACTGEQIKAPSGQSYILTAGHCRPLEKDGQILATAEDGRSALRRVIAEDEKSDLLLLEGMPGVEGFSIAQSISRFEGVRAFTHGHKFPTYKTEGLLIGIERVKIGLFPVTSEEEAAKCKAKAKQSLVDALFFQICIMDIEETASTVAVVPGSSGGPVLNAHSEVVGVVSAGGEGFSYLVKLSDIGAFIRGY